jgi:hypothetical protein
MPGIELSSVAEVATVAGWPGTRSLFRTGWTSFTADRVTVYHRLDDSGEGPSIEVSTFVRGVARDRSTHSLLLERLSALKSPPQEKRVALLVDGASREWSVLQARNAWVAASEDANPLITIFAREFPLGAVYLERVAISELNGFDRLVPGYV